MRVYTPVVQAKAGEGAGNGLGKHEQRYCSIRHVRGWQETKALKTDLRETEYEQWKMMRARRVRLGGKR